MNEPDPLMEALRAWGQAEIRATRAPGHGPALLLRARLAREEARHRRAARLERLWAGLAAAAALLVLAGFGRQILEGAAPLAATASLLPILAALALAGAGLAWAME